MYSNIFMGLATLAESVVPLEPMMDWLYGMNRISRSAFAKLRITEHCMRHVGFFHFADFKP